MTKGAVPLFRSGESDFDLYLGDCRSILPCVRERFDMVFADPPYFLSNGGFSVQSGKQVPVDKGAWDRSKGREDDRKFTIEWLSECRRLMKPNATIWVCGTFHNIFTVAEAMSALGFKILNSITWQKTNPPPNLSCRYFTHSTEILLWARRDPGIPHRYNYSLMRFLANDRQMTDVWRMPAISRWEKEFGKHPTQKPIALVARAILACTDIGDVVLDPFTGSGTTGIAANLTGRRFVGIESDRHYLSIACGRRNALLSRRSEWEMKIPDLCALKSVHVDLHDADLI